MSATAGNLTFTDAPGIAALVPMARLLGSLGFEANERTRRAPCLLHAGSNPTAFAWRDDGRWHCFSCQAGGDKISLVRAVRQCGFREAVEYLAALAGVEFRAHRTSQRELALKARQKLRADNAKWHIADEIGRLRRYYMDGLHRSERLQKRAGLELLRADSTVARETVWERLARLAPVCTFFSAGWQFVWNASPEMLTRFALAAPRKRRRFILEGEAGA